ncbi:MAG: OmpA family protein [Candidatus Gastranaerophilales bacterium]|nr:OmpA family protein [Candidatus Gastranaerophilales bacterium]
MIRNSRIKTEYEDKNVFWASMSDLLLGMTVIFIVLFALAMIGLTKQNINQLNFKQEISETLSQEFKKNNIPVEIDKLTGNLKISDLELFELNDWKLSKKGEEYLNKVIPIYFDTILGNEEIKNNISQIIIEGHTDSQTFKETSSEEANYIKNLDLSLKRAYAISEYIVNLDYTNDNNYKKDLIKLLSTNGRSYSSPIMNGEHEDYYKSRRVELKFQLKDFSFIEVLKKYTFTKESE